MKKAFLTIFSFLFVLSIAISCSKSNPTSPQPTATNTVPTSTSTVTLTHTFTATATATQTGLFVERADIIQSQSSHGVGGSTAYFTLRYGNASGAYVQGATITIGTGTLTESTPGNYTLGFTNTADLANISVSISSLAGNASSSLTVPYDAYIFTTSSSGGNQSAASAMSVSWDYCATTCPLPQKVRLLIWRSSDSAVYWDQTYTPVNNGEGISVPAYTLPNMGQIYMRAYSFNQAAIVGANGGSATFRFLNSENERYVNMTP